MDESVASRVRELVSDHLGVEPEELEPSVLLADDLAADSLDLVEVCLGLESEFDIAVPERLLDRVRTFGDLVDLTLTLARERHRSTWIPPQAPRIWTHVVPATGVPTIERTLPLTAYTADEVAGDALHAGPGSRLEVTAPANASDRILAWVQDQFAWLRQRGIEVTIDRAHAPRRRRPRPKAA